MSTPKAFATPAAFRKWLERNGRKETELLVRCFKVRAAKRGIGYREALDEALCCGWIDGVRRGLDDDSFTVRFSPRNPKSVWSAVNIERARELEAEGRMTDIGRAAFEVRRSAKGRYSFESEPADFAPAMTKRFRARSKAFAFWSAQPPGYRKVATFWVMSAKQEATRERRFDTVVACSERGERIPLLARPRRRDKG